MKLWLILNKKPMLIEKDLLNQVGLSDKESEIYQILLKLGKVPANKILPETDLKRTTVYSILDDLLAKDIITKDDTHKITEFRAKHPYALKEFLEAKVSQIKTAESKLDAVLPDFISLYNTAQNRPGVKFYEGIEGIKKVWWDSLKSKTEIYTLGDLEVLAKKFGNLNKKYFQQRKKINIFKKAITVDSEFNRKFLKTYDTKYTYTKLIKNFPIDFSSTIMEIYDNKISYTTLVGDLYIGVVINDKSIYNMHKTLFEFIWQQAEDVNH